MWGIALGLFGAAPASAEGSPVWVWYRNSQGCPDGATFIARLTELGHAAQLAQVGDRVDFVVTLGQRADTSSGRLERQTLAGTVAMREYRDAHCEQVAEALALTLDLALDPNVAGAPETSSLSSDTPPPRPLATVDAPSVGAAPATSLDAASLTVGGQALLAIGIAPSPLLGGALFGSIEDPDWVVEHARATLFGARGNGRARAREIGVSLIGARLEGCPALWRTSAVALAPCAALELGLLRAAGSDALGAADTGFWSAALAHGRVVFDLGAALALEAQLGARLPLVRYEMGPLDGSAAWFRTRALGLDAGLGLAWQIP